MQPRQMKKIKDDAAALVEHLKQTLGATWSIACQPFNRLQAVLKTPSTKPGTIVAVYLQIRPRLREIYGDIATKIVLRVGLSS
eukprot:4574360-Pleurochrysis_carterae.AAC.1